jgi:hypothetical protein
MLCRIETHEGNIRVVDWSSQEIACKRNIFFSRIQIEGEKTCTKAMTDNFVNL